MSDKRMLGQWGEKIAREYLEKEGYEIIAQNYHTRFGEIDIIALDRGQFVFAEVKTRTSADFGFPSEAVTRDKQRKMALAAQKYLLENKKNNDNFRLDAVSVELNEADKKAKIRHFKSITNN